MPAVRMHATAVINEWTLDELHRAFETPVHPLNIRVSRSYADKATLDRYMGGKRDDWYGGDVRCMSDVDRLLTEGWEKGAKRLEDMRVQLNPPVAKSRRRKPQWRDQGDDLNVERAMAGDWDAAWRSSVRVWSNGPQTIDLYTIYGGAASLTAEQIFWNGAACVIAADQLEAAGYRVRIVACFLHSANSTTDYDSYGDESKVLRSDVVIKDAADPLRIDGLAAVMCHAAVYRTYLFRTWLTAPVRLTHGLGPAIYQFTPGAIKALKTAGEWPEGSIVIDQALDRESCLQRIAEVTKQITG